MELVPGHDGALPNPRGVKLTYDDFVLFPDDGLRHELIDGEHYVTPSPNAKHQKMLANLASADRPLVAHARPSERCSLPHSMSSSRNWTS